MTDASGMQHLALPGSLRRGAKFYSYVLEDSRVGTFVLGGYSLWACPGKEPVITPGNGVVVIDIIKCPLAKIHLLAKLKFFTLKSLKEMAYRDLSVLLPLAAKPPKGYTKSLTGDFLNP